MRKIFMLSSIIMLTLFSGSQIVAGSSTSLNDIRLGNGSPMPEIPRFHVLDVLSSSKTKNKVATKKLSAGSISECGDITATGRYTLANDLEGQKNGCIFMHDIPQSNIKVTLDCNKHRVSAGLTPPLL